MRFIFFFWNARCAFFTKGLQFFGKSSVLEFCTLAFHSCCAIAEHFFIAEFWNVCFPLLEKVVKLIQLYFYVPIIESKEDLEMYGFFIHSCLLNFIVTRARKVLISPRSMKQWFLKCSAVQQPFSLVACSTLFSSSSSSPPDFFAFVVGNAVRSFVLSLLALFRLSPLGNSSLNLCVTQPSPGVGGWVSRAGGCLWLLDSHPRYARPS